MNIVGKYHLTTQSDLLPEEVEEFKRITKEVKGIDLTDEQARDQGCRFINLYELMAQNLKPEELVHKTKQKPDDIPLIPSPGKVRNKC